MSSPNQVSDEVKAKFEKLQKQKERSTTWYWKLLEVVYDTDRKSGEVSVKLKCPLGCLLTSSNPSQSASDHFDKISGNCKKRAFTGKGTLCSYATADGSRI